MTSFDTVRLIALRELRERFRSKIFLLSTAISLLIVVALAVLPSLLGDDGPETYDVAVVGAEAAALVGALDSTVAQAGADVRIKRLDASAVDAERLVRAGDVDVAVLGSTQLLVDEELDDELGRLLDLAQQDYASRAALAAAGVTDAAAESALRPPRLEVRALDPPDAAADDREGLVFAGTVLLYGQLLGFGYWVATGILEEKSSRVVEVVLAKARPSLVLTGKIIGIGVLGFLQLVGYIVIGLVAAAATGSVDLPPSIVRIALEVIAWFVLGYALYSCLFAVGGALASRPEEMQSTTGPVSMLAIFSFFAAMAAGSDPGGTAARIATFVPPAAPMVLPVRSAAGELPLWEALVSIALVLLATYGAVRLAGRVYSGSALHVRSQLKLREALTRTR